MSATTLARDVDVLRSTTDRIAAMLPNSWRIELDTEPRAAGVAPDAVLRLRAPDGSAACFAVEVKLRVDGRDVTPALEQLRSGLVAGDDGRPLLMARYLSPPVRERLERSSVNYADATGNLWICAERPGLLLRDVGAQRDPWRATGRPRGSLRGETADRLIRALVDLRPPLALPRLAEVSGASIGATYRMVDFLEAEGVLRRTDPTGGRGRGPVTDVDWRSLIRRWADDIRTRTTSPRRYLAPRGVASVVDGLRALGGREDYVLTGSLAAANYAPYAPPALASLWAADPQAIAAELGLREIDTGANVLITVPAGPAPLQRARTIDGVRVAAPSQVAADLLNAPGRGPAEAEALLDWMAADEAAWRE